MNFRLFFNELPFSLKNLDSFLVRGLFILPLTAFGVMHFVTPHFFEFMVPEYVGPPIIWVYFSGVALTTSSLAIFLKIGAKFANLCLIGFVSIFILTVDLPHIWMHKDHWQFYFIISLMKDMSLLGGSMVYYFISRMRHGT